MLEMLEPCHNRMSLIALSDRGYFQEFDFEEVMMRPSQVAARFWLTEDIAAGTIAYARSDYRKVTDAVDEAGKFPELREQLQAKFPEVDWRGMAVVLTDEMIDAAVVIGRELLDEKG